MIPKDSGNTMSNQKSQAWYYHLSFLFLILIFATAHRIYQFRGFGALDDFAYAQLAHQVSEGWPFIGVFDGPAVFPLRVGIIYPTAWLFRFFGVGEWTQVAFPFLLSILGVVLAYLCTRLFFGARAGLVAAAIWAFLPLDSFYATVLAPDLPAAFFLGAAVVTVVAGLRWKVEHRGVLFLTGIAAGLFLGVSWLCKESLAYSAPFFVFLAVTTLWKTPGRNGMLWLGVAVGSAVVLLAEATVYYQATGDWLFHLHEMERNYQQNLNAFFVEGSDRVGNADYLKAVVRRVFLDGPFFILTNHQFVYLPLVGLLACLYAVFHRNRDMLIPGVWLVTLLFMFNFGSSSTQSYVPLVLFDRYLFPIALPSVVVVAGFLNHLFDRVRAEAPQLNRERMFWGSAITAFLILAFADKNYGNHGYSPNWASDVRAVSGMLQPSDRVYADVLSLHGLEFYWSFPEVMNTVNFQEMSPSSTLDEGGFVLLNEAYLEWLGRFSGWWPTKSGAAQRPVFADDPPPSWEMVWSSDNATLYRIR